MAMIVIVIMNVTLVSGLEELMQAFLLPCKCQAMNCTMMYIAWVLQRLDLQNSARIQAHSKLASATKRQETLTVAQTRVVDYQLLQNEPRRRRLFLSSD